MAPLLSSDVFLLVMLAPGASVCPALGLVGVDTAEVAAEASPAPTALIVRCGVLDRTPRGGGWGVGPLAVAPAGAAARAAATAGGATGAPCLPRRAFCEAECSSPAILIFALSSLVFLFHPPSVLTGRIGQFS